MKPSVVCILSAVALLAACGRREAEPRVYVERAPDPAAAPETAPAELPSMNVPMPPAADVEWTAPKGWTAMPGQGMRRATFVIRDDAGEYECSLISLAGEAGGLAANIHRWAGQIGLGLAPDALRAFIDSIPQRSTSAGTPLWIVDFTEAAADRADGEPWMLAAIVRRPADTLFLRLTAPRPVIEAHREAFVQLAASLR